MTKVVFLFYSITMQLENTLSGVAGLNLLRGCLGVSWRGWGWRCHARSCRHLWLWQQTVRHIRRGLNRTPWVIASRRHRTATIGFH